MAFVPKRWCRICRRGALPCRPLAATGKRRGDKEQGINPILLDGMAVDTAALAGVTHVLVSAPPTQEGDPLLPLFDAALRAHGRAIDWLGYLSTTGVYGDLPVHGLTRTHWRARLVRAGNAVWPQSGLGWHWARRLILACIFSGWPVFTAPIAASSPR